MQRKSKSCKQLKQYFITRIVNQLLRRGGKGASGGHMMYNYVYVNY